ncbi:MAG: MATE family efflux transporter [Pseudomonadota bacterium]
MKTQDFKKQVPKNIIINVFSFGITVLAGLWLTPYLLKTLGIVAYGLIPLAMFFSQYVGVILNSINISISRFLLISLQKRQDQVANEIFNTSFVIILAFSIVQAVIMLVVLFDINYFFNISDELVEDAIWLFGLTFIGFSISLLRSIFGTSLFAYNRLDKLRLIDVLQNVVRLIIIVSLFLYDKPSLKYIGVANLFASVSAFIPTLHYFKKYTPQLRINLSLFKKHRAAELSKLSVWILINQVGVLLFGNADLYIVNKFISVSATGEYAIIIQVTSLFRTLAGLLATVLTPVIMIYYTNNEHKKIKNILVLSAKLLSLVIVIPLVVTIYFSGDLIAVWLGEEYRYIANILSYSLLFLLFAVPTMPLYSVNVAYNRVKLPAILTILLGVVNIISIYLLISYTDLGLWSVVLARLIYEFLYNSIFMSIYVSKIIKTNYRVLFQIPMITVLYFILIYISIYSIDYMLNITSLLNIIILSIGLSIMFTPIFYLLFFSNEEKKFIKSRYFNKFLNKMNM